MPETITQYTKYQIITLNTFINRFLLAVFVIYVLVSLRIILNKV